MRLRSAICTATGMAALALAPSAHAGTASIDFNVVDESQPAAGFLNYVADPGERNELTVTYHDGHWVFHDAISPMRTTNCTVVDEHTVDCNAGEGPDFDDPDYASMG